MEQLLELSLVVSVVGGVGEFFWVSVGTGSRRGGKSRPFLV